MFVFLLKWYTILFLLMERSCAGMYLYGLFFHKVPELCEDLLSSVDQPLKIARDKDTGKDYLLCDYNRDGDSYR